MARVAIVGTAGELPDALRALAAEVAGGVEAEVLAADQLVARLAGGAAYEAVVLAAVEQAVPLVQQVSRIDRDVAVCVLCAPADEGRVRREVQFAPFVGEDVSVRALDGDPTLAADVIEMAGRTSARRRHRDTIDAASLTLAGLAAGPSVPGSVDASIRRHSAFAALEQLVADAPVGVGLLDRDLRYVRVNAFIRRLAGRDVTGGLLGEARPEHGLAFREAAAAVLQRGDPELRREFELPDPDKPGATVHVLANLFPVRDEDGAVVGAAVILFDLTDQRHSQTLLAVQYEVARALAEERATGAAARRIMAAVCRVLGWQLGALWRTDDYSGLLRFVDSWAEPDVDGERFLVESRDFALPRGEGLLGGAWGTAEPVWIADLRAEAGASVVRREFLIELGFRTALAFPITVGGGPIGIMEFLSTAPRERDVDLLDVLTSAGTQVGQFVERLSAEAELRRSERERERLVGAMLLAAGEQRRLIARDLHDDTIQVMTAILLQLDRLARRLDTGGVAAIRDDLERVRRTLATATERVRRLTFELRPQILEAQGLAPAIQELAALTAADAPFAVDADVRVGRHRWGVEELVYRTVAEALANAREHSGATAVRVAVREREGRIEAEVVDDGRGFDVARLRATARVGHLGIRPLGERVRLSGGDFRLESAPGEGTAVRFSVPVAAEAVPLPAQEDDDGFRLYRQSDEWLALLDTLLDRAPIGLGFWDRAYRYVRLNEALAALTGMPIERHLGRTPADVVPELWPALEPVFQAVVERGAEFIDLEVHGETPASPGVERTWLASYYPVQSRAGDVLGVGAVVVDVTERKAAEAERNALLAETQAARDRLALLSSVSGALAETIELEPTLEHVTRLVVETLADWCELDLLEDGALRPAGRAHADAGSIELLDRFRGDAHPWAEERRRAARGRWPIVLDDVAERIAGIADSGLREVAESLRPGSVMLVPLVSRARTLGLLTCARTAGGRPYDADDLALAREVASRAAVAIDNARLFEHRSTVARTLQDRLLPPALPPVPGLRLAARYEQVGAEVGGDFYDVFEMAHGEWGILVGDVSGKGVGAAALTGLVRHTLRAVAGYRRQEGAIAAVNAALVDEGPEQFCTLVFTRYRPGERGGRLEVRLAGHPPPVLVRADGTTEDVGIPGTLLGFLDEPQITPAWVELGPGDAVVLYTDGVTEAKRGADLFGEARLAAVLAACAGLDADAIADEVVSAVRGYQQSARDDLTVLVLSVPREEDG